MLILKKKKHYLQDTILNKVDYSDQHQNVIVTLKYQIEDSNWDFTKTFFEVKQVSIYRIQCPVA